MILFNHLDRILRFSITLSLYVLWDIYWGKKEVLVTNKGRKSAQMAKEEHNVDISALFKLTQVLVLFFWYNYTCFLVYSKIIKCLLFAMSTNFWTQSSETALNALGALSLATLRWCRTIKIETGVHCTKFDTDDIVHNDAMIFKTLVTNMIQVVCVL